MGKDECAGEWIYERLGPWMSELGVEVLYEPREEEKEEEERKNEKVGGEKRFGHIVSRGVRLGLARRKMAAKSGSGRGRGGLEEEEEVVVRWEMCRVNPLLRFLKYRPGQFFHRNPPPFPTELRLYSC